MNDKIIKEIVKELDLIPEDEQFAQRTKSATLSLFKLCSQYLWYDTLNQNLNNAKGILDNYLNEEDCLNKRKQKGDRMRDPSLCITSKLYIEFFWKSYKKYYEKIEDTNIERKFFREITDSIDISKAVDKAWNDIFIDSETDFTSIKESVKDSLIEWTDMYHNVAYIKNLNFANLHKAMNIFKKALTLPTLSEEESAAIVIDDEIQIYLLNCLKEKAYPQCLFTVAPMSRALFEGKVNSYIKGNTTVYFKFEKGHEHNLTQLKNYINALRDLYDEYIEVQCNIATYTH